MPQPDPNVEPLKDTDAAKIREAVAALSRADKKKARQKPETPQNVADTGQDNETHLKPQLTEAPAISDAGRRAEAMLYASAQPISAEELASSLPQGADVAQILMELKALYTGRGVELVEVAGKWRFQTASDLSFLFEETREEQRKLSRAALETLAAIAYRQPVTRAEIEDVRGVAVSRGTLDVLMEMNWVKARGRRRSPGRPMVYGVTDAFLEHFGLESLDMLPGLDEMRQAGLLSGAVPDDFDMPRPIESEADDDLIEQLSEPESANDDGMFVEDFLGDAED